MKIIVLITLILASALNASVIEGKFDSSEILRNFPEYSNNREMLMYQYERDDRLSGIITGAWEMTQ